MLRYAIKISFIINARRAGLLSLRTASRNVVRRSYVPFFVKTIANPRLLYVKAALFLCAGVLASALLIARSPHCTTVALLALAVWAFARAYYFAFHVLERYIDGSFRFSGLGSLLRYLMNRTTVS